MPVAAPASRDAGAPFSATAPTRRWSDGMAPAVAVAVAVGVTLRFLTRSALWLDEALSINVARLPLSDIGAALRHDGHPPLYYWLLHLWTVALGAGDGAVRALSGVASVATLPVAWVAGRRLGGRPAAVAALVLLALSPYAVRYATEARMYALVMLAVTAGALAVRRALERPSPGRLVAVGALAAAVVWLQYWGLYLVAATFIVLVAAAFGWPRRATGRGERVAAGRVAVAVAVGAASLAPWLPTFFDQVRHTGTPWADPTRPTTALAITLDDLGGNLIDGHLVGVALVLLTALALFVAPSAGRPDAIASGGNATRPRGGSGLRLELATVPGVRAEAAVVALTLALGTAATFLSGGGYATRYAAVVVPLVLLIAAAGVARLPRPGVRAGALVAVGLLCLPGLARGVVERRTQGPVVVAALNQAAGPGDVVVYCPDQLGPAFSRGLKGGVDARTFPTGARPERVDWRDYGARNAAADPVAAADQALAAAGAHDVWLVWSAGYRTLGLRCEQLAARLQEARGVPAIAVTDDGATYAEHGWLMRYPSGA